MIMVVRIGKVLVATRAHLSYMELMVVLSFSGLRAVVTFFRERAAEEMVRA